MVRVIRIPNAARWKQDIQLDGRLYTLTGWYNTRMETWFADLGLSDGEVILKGLRLVLNWPLFYGSNYDPRLPPGNLYVVSPSGQQVSDPGRTDFVDGNVALVYVGNED
ncbi:MAG: hypothetical protein FKY71_08330 [Spiribacter salinus]|uniref:Cyanophage baseplate Pam3 plug gp18 domain-containing protein n=1 Tax=Spiribacter salinus TaxID=1335746 RepID=A0A540VTN4_9GAMM|nr:MAG: hypothetical protein FKY71_08330 [Spiribacter salinus]